MHISAASSYATTSYAQTQATPQASLAAAEGRAAPVALTQTQGAVKAAEVSQRPNQNVKPDEKRTEVAQRDAASLREGGAPRPGSLVDIRI